jgi:hypothetical protein
MLPSAIVLGGIRQGLPSPGPNHLKATGGWPDVNPDISRADLAAIATKLRALRATLRDSCSLLLPDQRKSDEALAECMSGACGLAG